MTTRLTKALAALAAVAVLAWPGPQSARASAGRGPYDNASGQWYADQERDHARLGYDAYGMGRARDSRPNYPGRAVYSGSYASPAAPADYYSGTPTSDSASSADYAYGAYAPPATARDTTAHIRLIVSAGTKVWFDNSATQQTGSVRSFESPELTPGKDYAYDVTARWTENGKEVTRTRHVGVSAGSSVTVDFTQQ
jgi:uncharacterized protein (TIGR03000 family)